jgi:hypothetical protein
LGIRKEEGIGPFKAVTASRMDYERLGALALKRGDYAEAVNIFRRVLEARKTAAAYLGLGRAFHGLADYPAARWAFYKALKLEPLSEEARGLAASVESLAEAPPPPARRLSLFRAAEDYLEINAGGWRRFFIKGMNLGLGLPGYFPGEFALRKATYLGWLKLMSRMGINTLRLYTLHPPVFYEALRQFNAAGRGRIYLLQGIWTELPPGDDFDDEKYQGRLARDIADVVDAVYGNADVPESPGRAHGAYRHDVSAEVAGFIFGREWESCAVKSFNDRAGRKTADYEGEFIAAREGTPFERWAARMCDSIQRREQTRYGTSHPVSITNWPTLDPLVHPSESDYEDQLARQGIRLRSSQCNENEDMESLDVAKFKSLRGAGFFATYHAYPYYPDFMNNDYLEAENTYLAYLGDLKRHHGGQPVLIGEFGVPSSREVSHWHRDGWHHGGHNDRSQGEIDGRLMRSIHEAGMAGGVVFSWFDEWYKRNWLFLPHELPAERNRLWFSLQDAEQNYGFLATYPGYPGPVVTLAGDGAEWADAALLYEKKGGPVFSFRDGLDGARTLTRMLALHDEGFLYVRLETEGEVDPAQAGYLIGFDTCSPEQGEFLLPFGTGLSSPVGLKFLVHIAGKENSRILACNSYDKYLNAEKGVIVPGRSDQGSWVVMQNRANMRRISKDGEHFYPSRVFSMSGLRFGSLRRESSSYDSLSDFFYEGNAIELRIPWSLLNFTDPSSRRVLWKDGRQSTRKTDGIRLVAVSYKPVAGRLYAEATGLPSRAADHLPGRFSAPGEVATYTWREWQVPIYNTFVKESYRAYQKALSAIPEEAGA